MRCVGCGCLTASRRQPREPGVRRRGGHGRCEACSRREQRAAKREGRPPVWANGAARAHRGAQQTEPEDTSVGQRRRAALWVCAKASSVDEARLVLQVLGLVEAA